MATTIIKLNNPLAPGDALQQVSLGANAIGTDGKVPRYSPDAGFKIWSIDQLFDGGVAQNKHIPNINDLVVIWQGMNIGFGKVIGYDLNMSSIIQELGIGADGGGMNPWDIFTGVGYGAPSDTYRVYMDTTSTPMRLNIDSFLTVNGTQAKYFKLFKGSSVGDPGAQVSLRFNGSGVYVTDPIELVPLTTNNAQTVTWGFPEFYTKTPLVNNEVLTLVVYTSSGAVYHHRQLLVQNTNHFKAVDYVTKEIDHIALTSSLLNISTGEIEHPVDMTVGSLGMICTVVYKDGRTAVVPVDGNRARILGLDKYQATYPGQRFMVGLQYALQSNERYAGDGLSIDGSMITRIYPAVTTSSDGHNYRLFVQPVWNISQEKYVLHWWLHNLNRNVSYDATGLVSTQFGQATFNDALYGQWQTLNVSIDVSNVSVSLAPHRHTQTVSVRINGNPKFNDTPIEVQYNLDFGVTFGSNAIALAQDIDNKDTRVFLANTQPNTTQRLIKLYYSTSPAYDPPDNNSVYVPYNINTIQALVPKPTHVEVRVTNSIVPVPNPVVISITEGDMVLTLPGKISNWLGQTLKLTFYVESDQGAINYLASSSVYIR